MHTKGKWEVTDINDTSLGLFWRLLCNSKFVGHIANKEDAKHICRCVNNFKPMLEALKDIRRQNKSGLFGLPVHIQNQIDKAIKNAEDKS